MDRVSQKKGQLDVRVLGGSELSFRGHILARTVFDKPTSLLFYLAVERRRHPRADLINLFWPEMDEASGRQNLNSTIYILKKRFNNFPVIDCDRFFVWWGPSGGGPDPVDLFRFMENDPPRGCDTLHEPSICAVCQEKLTTCLSEYRGDFLENASVPHLPAYERWIREVRERVRSRGSYLKGLLSGTMPVLPAEGYSDSGWESRQVTILCFHVESENREDLQTLVRQIGTCRDLFAASSMKNGGWVAPFHGVGCLSYFGFPSAQENAARQAVRTALDILEKIRMSDEILPFARIGIHTGEVICDLVRGVPDILGEATRTATMVADESGPWEILVTEWTIGSVDRFFLSEPYGEKPIFNGQDRLAMHRILGEAETLSFGEVFVGRKKEQKSLVHLWREVVRGEKKVVWVTGEAGIGKSRLVHDLVRSLGPSAAVRELYCFPECQGTPWFPLIRFYRKFLGLNHRKTVEEVQYLAEKYLLSLERPVAEDLPYFLLFLLGEGKWSKNLPPLSPEKTGVLIENLMVDLLSLRVRKLPVLLVVEDLPWADGATIGLIGNTLRKISGRLMVLITSRTPESLRSLSSGDPDIHIDLAPLDSDEAQELVQALSPEALSSEEIRKLVDLGSGMPLFLEEYVRMRSLPSGPQTTGFSPNTLELLSARIDDLGEYRELAQVAACLGLEFPMVLLEKVFSAWRPGSSAEIWDCGIKALLGKGILKKMEDDPESMMAFRHAILRDAILRSLNDSTRMRIHQRTVDVLKEQFSQRIDQEPEFLAEHLMKARMFEEVLPVLVRAAERAISMGAIGDAGSHLEKALEIVRGGDSEASAERELDLLLVIGPVCRALHGYGSEQIDAIYRRAFELCEKVGRSFRTFPLLYAMWASAITRFGPGEALGWAQDLVVHSRKSGHTDERVRANHVLGSTLSWTGKLSESERCLKDALSEAAGFYDFSRKQPLSPYAEEPVVGLMCDLSRIYWLQGRSEEAENWAGRAIERSTDLNHLLSQCLSLSSMTLVHFFSGETEKADAVSRKLLFLSKAHGFELWENSALFSIGWSKENGEGCDMMREAKRVIMKDLPGYAPLYSVFEADGAIRAKRPEAALLAVEEGRREAASTGISIFDPEFLRLSGEARLMIDPSRPDLSRDLFSEALDKSLSIGAFGLGLKAAFSLERVSPGDRGRLRVILDRFPEIGRTPDWDQAIRIGLNFPERSGDLRLF